MPKSLSAQSTELPDLGGNAGLITEPKLKTIPEFNDAIQFFGLR